MLETDRFVYQVIISTASSYIHLLTETDPDTLVRWSENYHVDDIQTWARDRIVGLLDNATELHSHIDLAAAQDAVRQHVERLEGADFSVPGIQPNIKGATK